MRGSRRNTHLPGSDSSRQSLLPDFLVLLPLLQQCFRRLDMRRCRNSVSLSAIVLVLLCDESTHVVDILREEKGERGCEGRWRCPLCCTEAIQAPRLLLGKYPKYSRPLPRGRIQDGKRIIKCNELWLCSRYFCRSCALCSPRSTSSGR
jgi:hypothetical protein